MFSSASVQFTSLNESKLVVCVHFVQVYFCVIELQSFFTALFCFDRFSCFV